MLSNIFLKASEFFGTDKTKPRTIVVREGEHLRLRCAAQGFPAPTVEWIRDDGKTIAIGAWEATSMPGHTLNITKVNRVHMGVYVCIVDNGIPFPVNQTFQLDVYCEFFFIYGEVYLNFIEFISLGGCEEIMYQLN